MKDPWYGKAREGKGGKLYCPTKLVDGSWCRWRGWTSATQEVGSPWAWVVRFASGTAWRTANLPLARKETEEAPQGKLRLAHGLGGLAFLEVGEERPDIDEGHGARVHVLRQ